MTPPKPITCDLAEADQIHPADLAAAGFRAIIRNRPDGRAGDPASTRPQAVAAFGLKGPSR